jgi:hypothetical protein
MVQLTPIEQGGQPELRSDSGDLRHDHNFFALTTAETNFILYFIRDGSIGREEWQQLMGGWGYCDRHAWAVLSIELSYLPGFCIRSAYLYTHILAQGVHALGRAISKRPSFARKILSERNPCFICKVSPRKRGFVADNLIAEGKDGRWLRTFCNNLVPHWQNHVCPRCIGAWTSGTLCRRHTIEALEGGNIIDFKSEHDRLKDLQHHVLTYEKSFGWYHRGTDRPEDRAALVSAIGWSSGWTSLNRIYEQ